jgi:hypothetical protein
MPTLSFNHSRKVRNGNFWGRCLLIWLVALALAAPAQSQPAEPNPDPNAPVVIHPGETVQPMPAVEAQPSPGAWDRWRIEKLPEDDDWTRHFRIGALVGLNISANFSTQGTFGVNHPPGVYDNGYVLPDNLGTAFGQTGNWGYNNASQLSGSTLTMQNTTQYTTSANAKDSSTDVGFDMAYGGNLCAWGSARIGWDLGFGLLPISITDKSTMPASVVQSTINFNTGGIVVPGAPYNGGFNRQGEPTIGYAPIGGTTNTVAGTITGSRTLDVTLYTVRLGPSIYWDLNQYFGLSAGVGPAVGIMTGSLKYNEMINTSTSVPSSGQIDGTEVVYGGYVNASLMYHLVENGDLYVGVQYMSLGDATISGNGRVGTLNLGGQVYLSAGINWPF